MELLYWTWLLNILRTKYEHELFRYNLHFNICILRTCLYTHSGWNRPMRPEQTEWEQRLKKGMCVWLPLSLPKEPQTSGKQALKGLWSNKWQCRELGVRVCWADFFRFNKCMNVTIFGHPGIQQPSVQNTQAVPLMVEMSFQISYVVVLTPSISKCDLYRKKVFIDIDLKWDHSPERDWLVPLRRGNLNRCGEDAVWKERAIHKLRRCQIHISSSTGPGRNQGCWHLDLELPTSGTWRQYISTTV